jgi:hypothetical protein
MIRLQAGQKMHPVVTLFQEINLNANLEMDRNLAQPDHVCWMIVRVLQAVLQITLKKVTHVYGMVPEQAALNVLQVPHLILLTSVVLLIPTQVWIVPCVQLAPIP